MQIETVQTTSRPMLYITRAATMAPQDIAAVMQEAFGAIGAFIARTQVRPVGPPLAIYRDWDETTQKMQIDLGFPVAPGDTARADGEVKVGETPRGAALMAVHKGSYATLRDTYRAIEDHIRQARLPMPPMAWEVYVGDPASTPEEELLTEIYMPLT